MVDVGRCVEFAQRLIDTAEGLRTVFFVRNASEFGGQLAE